MNLRLIVSCLIALLLTAGRALTADRVLPRQLTESKTLLRNVKVWGCQLQRIDQAAVAATKLDLVVIDAMKNAQAGIALSRAEVAALQKKPDGGRRLVMAYLSVGEAETYRSYWRKDWLTAPPVWLAAANEKWPGAYGVRFWEPAWQHIVFEGPASLLGNILDAGFDGVFLDRVDAYSDWEGERATAASDMVDLVARLATRARSVDSGFLIIGQNSEGLLTNKRYLANIDAVSKESLLFGRAGEGILNTDEEVAWSLKYLKPAHKSGLPVLAIEYLDDPLKKADARRRLANLGFLPFFANRLLDRTPAEP